MANGDAAADAGMDVIPETADRRMGYDEINKTRDYIAERSLSWIVEDVISSEVHAITQHGLGKITATAVGSISEAVSFPVPFASVPIIHVDYIGGRNPSGPFNPAGLVEVAGPTIGKGVSPSTSGLTVVINRTDAANLSNGWDYYYSWSATGVPA